jgi:RNA polymerase sigma-70 factor (ECF subfamily)
MVLAKQAPCSDATAREILARTDNHPYLLQLVCKRLFEAGDLPQVIEDIASDDIVSHFFAVDYEYLSPAEKQVLLYVAQTHTASSQDLGAQLGVTVSQASTLIHGLQRMGYIRQDAGVCCIPSWFLEQWLRREHGLEVDAIGSSVAGAESQPAFDAESSLELLRRAHGGDRAALVRLCERYHVAFRCWAEGRMPHSVRGKLDTEDLLRETLFGALAQIEVQREGELWDHLRHELLQRIREEIGRQPHPAAAAGPGGAEAEVLSSACPQEEVVGRAELRRYETALARLPPEERQAIVTRIEMGCGYEQVAEALGKPSAGAARMAVCRALVHLAREMSHA